MTRVCEGPSVQAQARNPVDAANSPAKIQPQGLDGIGEQGRGLGGKNLSDLFNRDLNQLRPDGANRLNPFGANAASPQGIDASRNAQGQGGCCQPGACGPQGAQNAQEAQAQQAQAQQAPQAPQQPGEQADAAAKDPKEMMKKLLGALGDILSKVIDQVAPGMGAKVKQLFDGIAGGGQQPQPQLPPANQIAP